MSYQKWSELPYAGERSAPHNGVNPQAGSWPLTFLKWDPDGQFLDPEDNKLKLEIKDPETIDWNEELKYVQEKSQNLLDEDELRGKYWGTGVPTKQFTPIMDKLIDTYDVPAPQASRMLAVLYSAIHDAFIVAWELKYKWDVARPNQLDPKLKPLLCTPKHPTYPSGHSVIAGCAESVMKYFFPIEGKKIHHLAEECANSRFSALVHFPIDNTEGLRLGRQLGDVIVSDLRKQRDDLNKPIDKLITKYENAKILPDLNTQAIPFNFTTDCSSYTKDNSGK